jgi:hypothetical protein
LFGRLNEVSQTHNTAQIQHCPISTSWIDSRHRKISTSLHFQNGRYNTAKIQHCSISKVTLIYFLNESIRDIVIYPHIKVWWYRTLLNFYCPFFMPCFGSHFENGRHLENFENAELLL